MMFQMARSGRKSDSVMWLHFTKLIKEDGEEDFRKARCNDCEKVLSRGKADTPHNSPYKSRSFVLKCSTFAHLGTYILPPPGGT